jgi:integrase
MATIEKRTTDIQTAWENALKRAEIEDFRFHDLRHSAASYLAMNGASIAEIAEVLGRPSKWSKAMPISAKPIQLKLSKV